jgi:hypothetical protein
VAVVVALDHDLGPKRRLVVEPSQAVQMYGEHLRIAAHAERRGLLAALRIALRRVGAFLTLRSVFWVSIIKSGIAGGWRLR